MTQKVDGSRKPLQVERQLEIINLLRAEKAVKIEDLSHRLGVSDNTIRRDLRTLEQQGILRRTQGGALLEDNLKGQTPFALRSRRNVEAKRRIAEVAAELIQPGTTVIVDAGTTTHELCPHLGRFSELTVITNSLEISLDLKPSANLSVILCGGIISETSRSLIGLPAEQFFSQIHGDLLFLSVRGVSLQKGLTNQNMQETPVKRAMIDSAGRVVVMADGSKFGHVALSSIAPVSAVDTIITDSSAPAEQIAALRELGLTVIVAPETNPQPSS